MAFAKIRCAVFWGAKGSVGIVFVIVIVIVIVIAIVIVIVIVFGVALIHVRHHHAHFTLAGTPSVHYAADFAVAKYQNTVGKLQ